MHPRARVAALTAAASVILSACAPTAAESHLEGSVWVANEGADSFTVLDADTGEVIATLTGLAAPHNVQAGGSPAVVWATGRGGVVGLDAEGLFPTQASPAGDHPAHVVEGARGEVFVTSAGDGVVHRFTSTLRRPRTIEVGGAPHGMRLSEDGTLGAVANTAAGTVDLLHLAGGEPHVQSVPVGASPVQVAVSEDGSTVFASVGGAEEVVRIDVDSATVTGRTAVPSAPAQVWLTRSGLVLSANQGTDREPGSTLSFIDAATMEVLDELETGSGPHGVVVSPDESRAWVTNAYDGSVTVVDLDRREVLETVDVGAFPNGITFSPVRPDAPDEDPLTLVLPPSYSSADQGGEHSHGFDDEHAHEGADESDEDDHEESGGHGH
jgi:YVTN family beta-propeller protein